MRQGVRVGLIVKVDKPGMVVIVGDLFDFGLIFFILQFIV
jgi:hypothetical protein